MKTKFQRVVSLFLLLSTMGILVGCAASGPRTMKMTRDDADWMMLRFHNRVTYGGMITVEEQARVKEAYQVYLKAFDDALKQADGDLNTPTPDNVRQLMDKLDNTMATIP